MHISGAVDADLTNVKASEVMASAVCNLWKEGKEGGYAVKHGQAPVSDFGTQRRKAKHTVHEVEFNQPNFFEKAFPCLFPYSVGGVEADRETQLDFRVHIQWTLQYHDRRFRKHVTYPFTTFSILQRRQALATARVQMRRLDFQREGKELLVLTPERLQQAAAEEDGNTAVSDATIRRLRQYVHGAVSRVQGSDQSRYQLRSQIWSTALYHGPPYVWITINPSDLHDPILQVFAGEDIDLNNFVASSGPNVAARAMNVAEDPYVAAKFFHFIIRVILETLFGIKVSKYKVCASLGILGEVAAYFGTVEAQGRGTLHLHLLLWLKHAPSFDDMRSLLRNDAFRQRIVKYIAANFRAYLPGLESAETVQRIPKEKDISFSRPPKPGSANYHEEIKQFELQLARMEQIHTCRVRRCLQYDKEGRLRCRRRAPFEKAVDDFVTEGGLWGPKRLYGFVNAWVPGILVNARCNNNGKFLTNGGDTKNITYYVTAYAAKKQGKEFNLSAILADAYAYHDTHPNVSYVGDIRAQQRLLLFCLVHAINRQQQLGAPMVMSYLMGWGDVYRSHTYSYLYWTSFSAALLSAHPTLKR